MYKTALLSLALLILVSATLVAADPAPKVIPGLKAAQDAYGRSQKEAKAEYLKKLKEIQSERAKSGDLDGALKVRELVKEIESEESTETATLRKKLAGSEWGWQEGTAEKITLKGDGTLVMTFLPTEKGFWHINPDKTVTLISESQLGGIMKFNRDFTSHITVFPGTKLARGGARLKKIERGVICLVRPFSGFLATYGESIGCNRVSGA